MQRYLQIMLFAFACGDNAEPSPDALPSEIDASLDASPDADIDARIEADANVDAMPDAQQCWQVVMLQCAEGGYLLCVPEDACTEPITCNGESVSYCGPGGG